MANIYANADTGDDSTGDGSIGTPYETLDKCLTEANSGDVIILNAATATYTMVNKVLPTEITIKGTVTPDPNGLSAIIDTNNSSATYTLSNTITMEDLIFQNWKTTSTISFIYTNTATGDAAVNFTRVIFKDIQFSSSTGSRGGFIGNGSQVSPSSVDSITKTFNECVFSNIKSNGVVYTTMLRSNSGNQFAYFNNCTWYADATGLGLPYIAGYGNSAGSIASITHKNWAIKNEHSTAIDFGNAVTESMDGCVYTGNVTLTANTTNMTNSDPLFLDVSNTDFRLRPSSPAIDGGQPL